MNSKHLSALQIQGVEKLGETMFPASDGIPSFRETQCARHLDRILDYMPAQDLKDLGMLLGLIAILPGFLVRFFVWSLEKLSVLPTPIGGLVRMIRLGLRGLIMSLYYGDPSVLKLLGYEVGVYTADLEQK